MHLPKHKLAIEVADKRHTDRPTNKEEEKEKKNLISKLGCEPIKINLDRQDFDIYLILLKHITALLNQIKH